MAPMPLASVLERWDALTARWALGPDERSALVGGFEGGPVDRIETYRLLCGEQRIRLIVELEPVLGRTFMSDARIREWLRAPNRNLGGRTPLNVMAGSPEWMRWLIDNTGALS
jgi:uncharacterized protein (DUF2384 family)